MYYTARTKQETNGTRKGTEKEGEKHENIIVSTWEMEVIGEKVVKQVDRELTTC